MSLAFSSHSERVLCGIDDKQPKERRKSRLRGQRDELLAALKMAYVALGRVSVSWTGPTGTEARVAWETARELIARIEGGK